MPAGYVEKALQRFMHTPSQPNTKHSAPSKWTVPDYGAKIQYAADEDNSLPLDEQGITLLRQIIGVFLFYARAVDNTMHVALGTLAAAQSQDTAQTMDAAIHHLLNHAASNPDAKVRFHQSDMILYAHSD
jgi:hypothetical protein